jgi:hypothetical protein
LPTIRCFLLVAALFVLLEGSAFAQAMFTGSIGNVFGGDAPSTKKTWALAIGGGGAHGIGSELEYSQTDNFFETADGVSHGKIVTLMPSIFVAVPIKAVRPYGIFGFGFIRQRTQASTGGILSSLARRRAPARRSAPRRRRSPDDSDRCRDHRGASPC